MRKIRSIGIKVCSNDAEKVRRLLKVKGLLRNNLKIVHEAGFVYFPIIDDDSKIKSIGTGLRIVKHFFEPQKHKHESYTMFVDIPDDLREWLPTSYDIVGTIILVKLPDILLSFKHEIGDALLGAHKQIESVCLVLPVDGEFRVRKVEVIAGNKSTETVHREYGLWLKVDVAKVFFSPRLAGERRRVADLVAKGERVVDMFAGVGPFSIMIARYGAPQWVVAMDKNRAAVNFAQYNIKRNNVDDIVRVAHSDAEYIGDVVGVERVDRVVMNLPFGGFDFFSKALMIADTECMIHYYEVLSVGDIDKRLDALRRCARIYGFRLTDINVQKIKSYAPYEFYTGFDIVAQKIADVA